MSCSSDSEDEKLKLILEAADTSLLTDSLFKEKKQDISTPPPIDLPKSQRYLQDDDPSCVDFVPSEAVQKFMSKKLTQLVQEQIEFINYSGANKTKKRKSRVRLLRDYDCYTTPYEDFEYKDVGPRKKPTITRRLVDSDDIDEESKLKSVAVDGNSILSLKETLNWTKRSKGTVLCYKLGGGANKAQHFLEPENEFTKLRRKNKWNESKIRTTKFSIN